ncbi:MAG: YbhB/YbcL family Raf kinase inhibitor-like protein [Candidatus Omnitrophica bacterium]|nr:YbhB/YbcL family Raf kinase inhibitor-like protein [Candidatus Omnitrophota bacterium]
MDKIFQRARIFIILGGVVLSFSGINAEGGKNMKLSSPEFKNMAFIPQKFTCQGKGINPELVIEDIPDNAKSLVLIMDDPDAPSGDFVHWVLYDIPVTSRIDENTSPGKEGLNSLGKSGYVSPCPPSGTHRYFFKIYALDKILDRDKGLSKYELEEEISAHLLDKAELVGLYQKR